ncbi:MAG: ATP-binding protein, partial [Candidatus Thermoplasmatota archaeon]|nr:ATP-binding protein [Candidatus Thermoplasmatota archaeon]
SYVQLLERRQGEELDEDSKEFMGYIVEGVQRMKRLIDDLLLFSRVGTQGKPLEPVSVQAAYEDAVANLQVALEESGAEISHGELPTAIGDGSQLTQLFQNLISNAIKFSREDAPPRIHVWAERKGATWTVTVRDNGVGVAEDQQERIFVIFQRSHHRHEYPGNGIGLAVCKKIAERHNGRIWVESPGPVDPEGMRDPVAFEGEGSAFRFTLDVVPSSQDERVPEPVETNLEDRSRELV